jgi:hypothetical protein
VDVVVVGAGFSGLFGGFDQYQKRCAEQVAQGYAGFARGKGGR